MGKEIRLLLVEDSENDALLILREFQKRNYTVEHKRIDTPEIFEEAIQDESWDVIISDFLLPAFNGLEALQILKQHQLDVPFIMVSGNIGEDTAVAVMRAGAKDYIMKDNLSRLMPAVERELREVDIRKQQRAAEIALEEQKELFKKLVESTSIAIAVSDEKYENIKFLNKRFSEIFGFTVDDLPNIEAWWLKAYPDEEYRNKIRLLWKEKIEQTTNNNNEINSSEAVVTCKDGTTRYIEVNFTSVGNENILTFVDLTERRQAEENLKESEEKFYTAFRSSPDSMTLTSFDDGRIVEVNEGFERFAGFEREEIIGKSEGELNLWANLDDRDKYRNSLLIIGHIRNFYTNLLDRHGNESICLISAEIIKFGGKKYILNVFKDITEQKKAEEALKRRDAILQSVNYAAEIFLMSSSWKENINSILERLGKATEVSKVLIAETKLNKDEALSYSFLEQWNAEENLTNDSEQIKTGLQTMTLTHLGLNRIREILIGGKIFYGNTKDFSSEEKVFFSKANVKSVVIVPIIVEDEFWGVIGFIDCFKPREWAPTEIDALKTAAGLIEITIQRLKIIEELRASENKFYKAFRSSPDSISISSLKDGNFIEVNDGFERISGYKREEVIGKTSNDLNLWKEHQVRDKMAAILLEEGYVHNFEAEICDKNQIVHICNISAEVIELKNEMFLVTITRDITKEKQAENDLHYRLEFEKVISDISTNFISLSHDDIDNGIDQALLEIGQFADSDAGYVFLFSDDKKSFGLRYLWHNEHSKMNKEALNELSCSSLPMGTKQILGSQPVVIHAVDDLSEEFSLEKKVFKSLGYKSLVDVPLVYQGDVIGFSGFSCNRMNRTWTDDEITLLHMVGQIISSAIKRKESESDLRNALAEVEKMKNRFQAENIYLQEELKFEHKFGDIISQNKTIKKALQKVEQVASTNASVLVVGETGTGKELFARAIHEQSQRKERPLIKVNCASIPRELFESEFFGHVKGAFTGAIKDRIGRFQLADGGSLFLDEVGEIPIELQGKLLRVLQEGEMEKIGEDKTHKVDVRIIAATNRDLSKEVEAGQFRQDLYFRLNVFPIEIIPLRERSEDIPLLARHFTTESCHRLGISDIKLKQKHVIQLQSYSWPGNIRELQNVIERAVITSRGGELQFIFPDELVNHDTSSSQQMADQSIQHGEVLSYYELKNIEKNNIINALNKTNWKIYGDDGAASVLGTKPTTLQSRIKALGIKKS